MGWKKLWLTMVLAFVGEFGIGFCEAQDLPPAPTPITNAPGSPAPVANAPGSENAPGPGSAVVPVPPVPAGPPVGPYAPVQPGFIPPPPPPPPGYMMNPYPDANGHLLRGDPSLEIPANRPPGWFGGLEADLVWPHIKN